MTRSPLLLLLGSLAPYARSHGYVLLAAQNQFRKSTNQGFFNLIVAAGPTFPALAELHLGIRIDLVEQLVYQFTIGLAGYGPHSTTLITSGGRIVGEPYQRYSLEQATDVSAVTQRMKDFLRTEGFPFLEEYGHVKPLDELYNRRPDEKSPYLTNALNRILRGIILAKLAQRNSWSDLVSDYRSQLIQRGTPESLVERYDRLVDYLRTFSVN